MLLIIVFRREVERRMFSIRIVPKFIYEFYVTTNDHDYMAKVVLRPYRTVNIVQHVDSYEYRSDLMFDGINKYTTFTMF